METDIPECYKRLEYVRMLYDKSYAPQYNSNPCIYTGYIHIQYTYIVEKELEYTKGVIRIRK